MLTVTLVAMLAFAGSAPAGAGPSDPEVARLRAHFARVITTLHADSPKVADPVARAHREALIDALGEYAAAGRFPRNSSVDGPRPVFIDEHGGTCAVGYLVEVSAGRDEAERIATTYRWDFIDDIDDAALGEWSLANGFSLDELALIQPSYHFRPPPRPPLVPGADELPPEVPAGFPELAFLRHYVVVALALIGSKREEWVDREGYTYRMWREDDGLHVRQLDPDGVRSGEGRLVGRMLMWRAWYQSGRLAAVGGFYDGLADGTWTVFDERGHYACARFAEGKVTSFLGCTDAPRPPAPTEGPARSEFRSGP